jgi:UDP-2,4-diacetamido-2,4,6-trideoxy-beta-L-altropyranose hydrolase
LLVVVADNPRGPARAMAEREAALVTDAAAADFDATFDRALMRLLRDAGLRRQLAATSAEVCDGLGAGRAVEAFLNLIAARAAAAS